MKKVVLVVVSFFWNFSLAQVFFSYDQEGNQVERGAIAVVESTSGTAHPLENQVTVAPNPTAGLVNITWTTQAVDKMDRIQVQSHNAFYQKTFPIATSQKSLSFDLTYEPSGLYFVKFFLKDTTSFSKTIIKN